MKTLYQLATEQMDASEIDRHETDLYLKKTDVSDKLISEYEFKGNVKTFIDQIEKCTWYEIPFAYDPQWEEKLS